MTWLRSHLVTPLPLCIHWCSHKSVQFQGEGKQSPLLYRSNVKASAAMFSNFQTHFTDGHIWGLGQADYFSQNTAQTTKWHSYDSNSSLMISIAKVRRLQDGPCGMIEPSAMSTYLRFSFLFLIGGGRNFSWRYWKEKTQTRFISIGFFF